MCVYDIFWDDLYTEIGIERDRERWEEMKTEMERWRVMERKRAKE